MAGRAAQYLAPLLLYAQRNAIVLTLGLVAVTTAGTAVTVSFLQSRRAARRFEEVRGLSHYLIFDTYDGMANLPGTTPLRKAVVAQAQLYLDRLARDAGDDPSLAAEIADSYFRLGMVLGYPYRPNLGDTQGALVNMDKARAILEPLVRKYPLRAQIAATLSTVYRRKAIVLTREDRADESIAASQHAVTILEAARKSVPLDAPRSLDLAGAQMTAGIVADWNASEHHWTPGFEAALSWLRQSMNTLETMPRGSNADNGNRAMMIATVQQNWSDTERNWGDSTGDPRHYEAALVSIREALDTSRTLPTEAKSPRDLGDGLVTMGRVLGALHRFAEAEANYQQALPEFERLVAADPDNLEAQQDLASLCNYRGETFALAGKKAEAAHWTHRSIPLYQSVLQHDPENREAAQLLATAKGRIAALNNMGNR